MSEHGSDSYVFRRDGDDMFAISHDMTGKNLPRATSQDWIFQHKLRVGEPAVPSAVGYYLWRDACWSQRTLAGNFHPSEPSAHPV